MIARADESVAWYDEKGMLRIAPGTGLQALREITDRTEEASIVMRYVCEHHMAIPHSLSLSEAKELHRGKMLHSPYLLNADGSPLRYSVLSVKTWKRTPGRVHISTKFGMYGYPKFDEGDLWMLMKGER